jgi:hypothetical protein
MERGNTKHSPREDEALADQLAGELAGSNREEWTAAEPPADDDPPERTDPPNPAESGAERGGAIDPDAADQDETEMRRLQHDMEVANDWNPARGDA